MQNGLGVLFAICWFAFLYLQNKQKVQTEEQLAAERNPEQSAVSDLKQEIRLCILYAVEAMMTERI